jgi:chemotaxis protein methyltransferase CheR
MVLADTMGTNGLWEVFASDISTAVLEKAERAHYPLERAQNMPEDFLKKYCLRGVGAQAGTLLIDAPLRNRVRFAQINLNAPLPQVGEFDVIFLRNVLIYFQLDVKRQVVARLTNQLKPGGWFIIGHSESLNGVNDTLQQVMPTVYRKKVEN